MSHKPTMTHINDSYYITTNLTILYYLMKLEHQPILQAYSVLLIF